ncbi:glycerophosphodiester phosphodiesterase family protein [Alphaproteobacteria bacterium]|nr:glycerophosphodiester phosphodiesterase family protein [Alphaproteobacteria bacterium]
MSDYDKSIPYLHSEQVCAHRGASGTAPENTMIALEKACGMAVGSVEFDISLLGDGSPIIHHDAHFGRTVRGSQRLQDLVLGDLEGRDAGAWFGDEFAGQSIPLLKDVLVLLGQHAKMPILDVKIHHDEHHAFAESLAVTLAGVSEQAVLDDYLISSFSRPFLESMRAIMVDAPLVLLDESLPSDWLDYSEALALKAIHLDYRRISPDDVRAVRSAGLDCRVYTANEPVAVHPLIEAGLTAVISDFPERFLAPTA